MSADLTQDVTAAAASAGTALVKTVRANDRHAKRRLDALLRGARKSTGRTAMQARRIPAEATEQAEHRYLDLKNGLRARPNTALEVGAVLALGLGLGLLLWIGYRTERQPSTR